MIKAMKKFKKLWPKKKKRKRTHQESYYYLPPVPLPPPPPLRPPPPPPVHCCYSYSIPLQPSAPPLPPWLECVQSQRQFQCEEIVLEAAAADSEIFHKVRSCVEATAVDDTLSYQQYTVPNPVYGVPVIEQTLIKERSSEFFGCFLGLGANFIRCFCPCFSRI
ncbi:uncharacterized protein LOC126661000 [Mercurialis annua]|uniref:uncharacterized protein LOC126661000 n=1 Tax=Mercurialis annua TaxID=3986 RepID=UPI0021603EE8|nr:uncharacterized protein LOC126661000 [Mercurialis annua]